jgi:hypothetical protein
MARKFLTNLDLTTAELQNAVIQNLASDPVSGNKDGRIYFNTTDKVIRVYANGAWVNIGDITDILGTTSQVTVSINAAGVATISLPSTINVNTSGNAATATKLATARNIALSGDVAGSANFDGTSDITISATIQANSVELGTDTTGNYVQTVSGTANQISVSGSGSESAAVTLSFPSAVTFPGTVTLHADPTQALQAATKQYVDGLVSGLDWHPAVNLLAAGNIALTGTSGTLVIDGHTALGDSDDGYRLLLKGQSTGSENGIYVYSDNGSTYTLSRASDADAYGELVGAAVFIMEGTTYGTTSWIQTNHYLTSFSGQVWTQFSGSGTYTAGNGLTLTGNSFSVDYTTVEAQLVTDKFAKKYAANVGNASATSIAVTHSLNTKDVVVNVYDNNSFDTVECDVVRTDVNTVTVSFATAPGSNAYRVVVIG